jgi:hypothetical protein
MLGHVVTVKRWKQSPPKCVSYKPSTTMFGASKVAPSTSGAAKASTIVEYALHENTSH